MPAYDSDTLVVRVPSSTKESLVERAKEHDRSLSAETRRALRAWLEHQAEPDEEERDA